MRPTSCWQAAIALCCSCAIAGAAEPLLKPGDVVTVVGDSITQMGIYSSYIETYLRACRPDLRIRVLQCGWGGTNATHFAGHMRKDVLTLEPTVGTICFGMNDGSYDNPDPAIERQYRESLGKIVDGYLEVKARTVIIGSPGVVDSRFFKNPRHPEVTATDYNRTLGQLGDIGKSVAAAKGMVFADLHTPMMAAMEQVKSRLGADYPFAGEIDGVHAGPPGHLGMAYGFLTAMGFDGDLATFAFDAAAGTATVSNGHRLVSASAGSLVIQSGRYPFCFFSGPKDPPQEHVLPGVLGQQNGTAVVLSGLPFNRDLNRWRLVVRNLSAAQARVTWGPQTRVYTARQLADGINLADEFLDNPFVKPFLALGQAVGRKQGFETMWIRGHLCDRRQTLIQALGADSPAVKTLDDGFLAVHADLAKRCDEALPPVTHSIAIEALP